MLIRGTILGRRLPICARLSTIELRRVSIARRLSGKLVYLSRPVHNGSAGNTDQAATDNTPIINVTKQSATIVENIGSATLNATGEDNGSSNSAKERPTEIPKRRPVSEVVIVKKSKRSSRIKRLLQRAVSISNSNVVKESATDVNWQDLLPDAYKQVEPPVDIRPPTLAHGLDRVLFNPGIHYLKDPRTGYYNFTPFLESLTQPADFNYNSIQPFTPSSRDQKLIQLAKDRNKRFVGSTSSVSGALSHCYYALSNFRGVDTSSLSKAFAHQPTGFTAGVKSPNTIILRWNQGVYAIEADKSYDSEETILSHMGQSMEKVLTLEEQEYTRFLKNSPSQISEEEKNQPGAYAYGELGDLLLRSQLDCEDKRLTRRTFDLKTRAAIPIRLDLSNYSNYIGYSLIRSHGLYESFEREYYDMMRSAFLKYSFQVRIGHMDGIMVAYHNTRKIFGFQYISREEMDSRLFGNTQTANETFRQTLSLFNTILKETVQLYPEQDLRVSFEAIKPKIAQTTHLNVFVEAISADPDKPSAEINAEEFFQTKAKLTSPHNDITMYRLEMKSVVNGLETRSPTDLKKEKDLWQVQYKLIKCTLTDELVKKKFTGLRARQFALGQARKNQPPILKTLRSISDKALIKENEEQDSTL